MNLSELGRELHVSRHDMWLLAAGLMRVGGWSAVFAAGTELTGPAEHAIRAHMHQGTAMTGRQSWSS